MTYVSSVEDPELDEVELDVLKQLGTCDGHPLAQQPVRRRQAQLLWRSSFNRRHPRTVPGRSSVAAGPLI